MPPVRHLGENFCARGEYFTMSNAVFNVNILALVFSEILGGPKFTQSEYFTISNCVYNFNILTLVVSEILGGSLIYVRGPCTPLYAP